MTIVTNTLGTYSSEIVITGPESYLNVASSVETIILGKGWYLVPNSTYSQVVTSSTSVNNLYTAASVVGLYVGMPVQFTAGGGAIFGNVSLATTYYIRSLPGGNTFSLSLNNYIQDNSATTFTLNTAPSGNMTMTSLLLGLTGNSTNTRQRVYWTYNLTGPVYKYIRLNLIDLTIDTAGQYTLSVVGSQNFYTATYQAYRLSHYQHLDYPRDYYMTNTTSPLGTGSTASAASPAFTISVNGANLTSGSFFSGATTTAYAANQGWPFYPGQQISLFSVSTGNYAISTISTWNEGTGTLTANVPLHASSSGSTYSDWVVLWPGVLNYNNSLNPAYVYISCSPRHICIQTRHTDGVWNDWIAVCEVENPLGFSLSSMSTTTTSSWGITTGYMSGNSGYTLNANTSATTTGLIPTATSGRTVTATYSKIQGSGGVWAQNEGVVTVVPARERMSMYGKYVQFTGPFSIPYTYKGRSGAYVSQTSKLITPLGEAGPIGTARRHAYSGQAWQSAEQTSVFIDNMTLFYFKGMGDVMPTQANTAAGAKHFAVTPSLTVDIGASNSDFPTFAAEFLLDDWSPAFTSTLVTNNSTSGFFSSYTNQSSTTITAQPTIMGRLYGIKYVTTSLNTLNTISIKLDTQGFVSSTGSATDHLIFSYPSYYTSPDVVTTIGSTYNKAVATSGKETQFTQNIIRTSQAVSVAFPK
jgi:hypothetical protein